MSEEIDPAVLKATKDALGKFVKKPPLSDKLLSKPPFKFLHDLFSAVIRDHGFMEGLFTPAEMKSDSFKDKDSKVAYIQKVIDVMEFVTEEKLGIKPGKVVAGLEASKTNLLLQSIGNGLSNKTKTSDAVKKVVDGEKPGGKKKDKDKSKKSKDGSPKKNKGGASLSDATNKSPDKKPKKDKEKKKKDDGDDKGKKSKSGDGEKPKKKKDAKGDAGEDKGKKKKDGTGKKKE
ncbi:TRAF3-interacting protein 1-like [Pollicipes pollicipes]|uniref:TRAF3-interacting protein 1-like n=1 Tax=Pollicipes pollicipes TaxID=41117 RepID=UPI001884B331|nr:TRAF3-interacting protein 1-like [Pollicipes pollicipes]XP_037069164.1 TRAF3-interacting protein 1-like [Pollicipes pollicipes]